MLEALFRAREILDLVRNMTYANQSKPVLDYEVPHVVGPPNGYVPQPVQAPSPLLLPLIIVILVFLVIILISMLGVVVVKFYLRRNHNVICHICHMEIERCFWTDGSHREICSRRHQEFLSSLPTPFDVRCPTCLAYLKLLPKENGRSFRCDDSDCAFKGEIANTGYNRLNCFSCDYDLCDSCAHRRMFILTKYLKYHGNRITESEIDNCSICQLEQSGYPVTLSVEHFSEMGGQRAHSSNLNLEPPDLGLPMIPSPVAYSSDPPSYTATPAASYALAPLATFV
ncbi:hypothetical protein TCAL_10488 [Tigriopus californicus]|uniref:Uncharacterized protein n=1 Tax=Tigriopus californicus TaxID=6832 RepID=A0A553PS02_TIGCA|nr:uncharacterized protein LOC131891712 isoform X2 [Tigriopus californicus]TRY80466.1 hypothetical protein TCAL_10488 [Tigriopus californicus]